MFRALCVFPGRAHLKETHQLLTNTITATATLLSLGQPLEMGSRELRVDFPWSHIHGSVERAQNREVQEQFKYPLGYPMVTSPWSRCLTFLSLGFVIYKTRLTIPIAMEL